MDITEILARVDHTLLGRTSTWEDIKTLCDDGLKYGVATVCIPPSFVKRASEYARGLKICTVIGFPNGYSTTEIKKLEAADAAANGADEIDMVIDLGMLKDRMYDGLLREMNEVKSAGGGRLLKVIVETCLLTEEEKIKMCSIISASDADYIKTSTGFSVRGAAREDVALFKKHIGSRVKIKAAGGIGTLDDAKDFIELGASRIGASSIVKAVKEMNRKAETPAV